MPKRSPTKKQNLTKVEPIEPVIRVIRRQRVILDSDLAEIYGVTTKRLNEQIKRNLERFPSDFMFRLTAVEAQAVQPVANCDRFSEAQRSPISPLRFHRTRRGNGC